MADDESEAASIASTKEFIKEARQETSKMVQELESQNDWQPVVMQSQVPVVLDCYAEWCAPCKKLMPILEQQIEAINADSGDKLKAKLVKLNIDNFPQLSTALQIRSIPAVFLVYRGNIVDTFSGIPDANTLNQFFSTAKLLDQMQSDESIMDDVFSKLEGMLKEGSLEQALNIVTDSAQLPLWQERYGTHMVVVKAYCELFLAKKNDKVADTIKIR